ncbi:MAG: DUF1599 domain-containing protein [Bacteroidales bacterium]|nr:DUF1599 domain-containing protein [Candidatus Scybalousia scybalohippi]
MEMTNEEIVLRYRRSDNQRDQIKILSELNDCDKADIQVILKENGLNNYMIGSYDLELVRNELIEHFENGGTKSEIAKRYRTDGNRINKVLGEMGILVDGKYVSKNSEKEKKTPRNTISFDEALVGSLKIDNRNLNKSVSDLKQSLSDVVETRRKLTDENNDLKQKLTELNSELDELKSKKCNCKCDTVSDNPLVARHKAVCDTLNVTYEQKNRAYGNSFDRTYNELGIISAVTRISDKFNRLCNLAKNTDCPTGDERIADTLLDMANYAIMTYMQVVKEESVEDDATN